MELQNLIYELGLAVATLQTKAEFILFFFFLFFFFFFCFVANLKGQKRHSL